MGCWILVVSLLLLVKRVESELQTDGVLSSPQLISSNVRLVSCSGRTVEQKRVYDLEVKLIV